MTNAISTFITAIHLAALSQIESNDNDLAVGRNGEVSRYQISRGIWDSHARIRRHGRYVVLDPREESTARIVAMYLWNDRVTWFEGEEKRAPTMTELYGLWHRPSRAGQLRPRELERAQRFANLVEEMEKK